VRSIPLSRRLIVVALAGVVPLAFMAALGLYELMNQQRAQAERAGIEISRALVTGVDAELGRSVSVLEAMAASPFIDGADLHAFDDLARRIVGTRVNWQRVILADAAGRPLLNTEASLDAASPETGEDSSFELMTRLRKPVVGRLIEGERGDFFFAVRVPILRDGAVRYVLSALVKPENVLAVVQRQRLPADWVSVFDATGIRVARSRQHEKFLGTRASPSLAVLMTEKGLEGAGMTHALEGERIYTAFSRGSEYGWSVAIGLPPSYVEAGEKRSLAVLGGGIGRAPGARILRNDVLRKRLAGLPPEERLPRGSYSDRAAELVYDCADKLGLAALSCGQSVVVDAVFAQRSHRIGIEAVAERADVPFSGLWLEAASDTRLRRVEGRGADASDADAAVAKAQGDLTIGDLGQWQCISATGPLREMAATARRILGSRTHEV